MALVKNSRRFRIRKGIRKKINGTADRPRLSVFKSNRGLYAQIINDQEGHTLVAASTLEIKGAKENSNIEDSKKLGALIAEKAKSSGIETVVFDRGGYLYHGKVKAMAESAREGGLKF
jgi:large subunit ribosomal protein L18